MSTVFQWSGVPDEVAGEEDEGVARQMRGFRLHLLHLATGILGETDHRSSPTNQLIRSAWERF